MYYRIYTLNILFCKPLPNFFQMFGLYVLYTSHTWHLYMTHALLQSIKGQYGLKPSELTSVSKFCQKIVLCRFIWTSISPQDEQTSTLVFVMRHFVTWMTFHSGFFWPQTRYWRNMHESKRHTCCMALHYIRGAHARSSLPELVRIRTLALLIWLRMFQLSQSWRLQWFDHRPLSSL